MLKNTRNHGVDFDTTVGFHITVNEIKYELVKNYTTWSIYVDGDEVFDGGYRRALQIILNLIGGGDLY